MAFIHGIQFRLQLLLLLSIVLVLTVVGVAVSPGSLPESGKLTFELGDDEIEIGMGLARAHHWQGKDRLAVNEVDRTLEKFPDEYEAHIKEHRCPGGVCKELIEFYIFAENCTGCTLCARSCPVDAISGERKQLHVIDSQVCIRCGMCREVCNQNAVFTR